MSAPAGTGTSLGSASTVTLTIVYPANFHRVGTSAKAGTSRAATYVNPTSTNYLHIYYTPKGGSMTEATPSGGIAVNPSAGTNAQTVTAPIPAGTSQTISATETNGSGVLLASGSTTQTIAAGGTANLAISMDMNAQSIVLTSDAVNASDAVLLSGSPTPFCAQNGTQNTVFAFPADAAGGFITPGTAVGGSVDTNGAAAIPPVYIVGQSAGDPSTLSASTLGFVAAFAATSSTILATFGVKNPIDGSTKSGVATLSGTGSPVCAPSASWSPASVATNATATLTISGGATPYTVTVTSGSCPAPTMVTTSSYTDTPTSTGTCAFKITDAHAKSTTATLTVTTAPPVIYFADANLGVTACDENGNNVSLSGFGGISYTTAITYDITNARFLVNDITQSNMLAFSKTGSTLTVSGFAGQRAGQNQLVWNPTNGHFYAAYNNIGGPDVIEWDGSGATINETGGFPGGRGVGLSFDAINQHLYVVDNDEYVYAFNTDGTSYATPGGFPTVASSRFAGGNDIQVDAADNRVFVVQKSPSIAMLVYDLQGNVVLTSGAFSGLNGNVVYDPYLHRVYGLGNPLKAWDINGNAVSLSGNCTNGGSAFAAVVVQ